MDATQTNRNVRIETPFGADVLLLNHFSATERISEPFEFELSLLSEKGDLNPDDILGKEVAIVVDLTPESDERHFHGLVTDFAQVGYGDRYHEYQATVRPWFWMLTRTADCRIFQNQSVPEIFEAVAKEHKFPDYKLKLRGTYPKWEYCVQYRETDFNFLSRLLEQEGIYYYFDHSSKGHMMVLADDPSAHVTIDSYATVPFYPPQTALNQRERDHLTAWSFRTSVQPGAYATRDFDFEKPKALPSATATIARKHAYSKFEIFDYPAELADLVTSDADRVAKIRIEEFGATQTLARGRGTAAGLATGARFTLAKYPREDLNKEYVIIGTLCSVTSNAYETGSSEESDFSISLEAVDAKVHFRPVRVTPKPVIQGTQTAVVVGKKGEEIFTDEHGRVKVQFHWDREGKFDENSSCWVRVAQLWAGTTWGGIHIPRIGQEVIVSFLEGDPDQPIITGRVYNGDNKVPYGLPANATQSGIKSRSSKGGAEANFNEFRFEDKKGSEQVYLHAEKNQDIVVENDETTKVGHDRTEEVGNNETITIHGSRRETVDKDETISIAGNRTEGVSKNESITIEKNRTESVGEDESVSIAKNQSVTVGNNRSLNVDKDESIVVSGNRSDQVGKDEEIQIGQNRNAKIGANDGLKVEKQLMIDAGDEIVIKTGSASITMKKDGSITIKGKDITLNGSGKINVKASADVIIKGSKVTQN